MRAADAAGRGDYRAAVALLTECRALARTPYEMGVMSAELGTALFRANQLNEARKWLEQALDVWVSKHEGFARYAQTSIMLAEVYRCLGQYEKAEQILRQVLSRAPSAATAVPADNEAHALALADLADMMREVGRSAQSRSLLNAANGLPGVSWRRQLDATLGLAELDRDTRNWEESIAEWNRVAAMSQEHNEPVLEAIAHRGLGETWLDRGNAARAEPLLRNALRSFEKDETANGRQIAFTLTALGQLYAGQDKLSLAEEALSKALAIDEKELGESHPQVAAILEVRGDTRSRMNQTELARHDLDRAIRILSNTFGDQSATCAAALATLGVIEQRARNFARAAQIYEQSLAAFVRTGPEVAGFRLAVMRRYAEVLKAAHRKREAGAVMAQIKSFGAQ
ncbi:MAG: tetratricopeptide repeat protein [Acidobacteriota bacterium]|nr:tetratricopeptide repeat protein [Acidobacteriota bacterium]